MERSKALLIHCIVHLCPWRQSCSVTIPVLDTQSTLPGAGSIYKYFSDSNGCHLDLMQPWHPQVESRPAGLSIEALGIIYGDERI